MHLEEIFSLFCFAALHLDISTLYNDAEEIFTMMQRKSPLQTLTIYCPKPKEASVSALTVYHPKTKRGICFRFLKQASRSGSNF
jgi:hypothetical protein